jgi:hypothetical protein
MPESNSRVEAFKLVDQALRLQLADDGGDLSEVGECLNKALDLGLGQYRGTTRGRSLL